MTARDPFTYAQRRVHDSCRLHDKLAPGGARLTAIHCLKLRKIAPRTGSRAAAISVISVVHLTGQNPLGTAPSVRVRA